MVCQKKCKKKETKATDKKLFFNIYENKVSRDTLTNENINAPIKIGTIWGFVKSKAPYYKEFNNSTYNDETTHIIKVNFIKELDTKKWLELDNKIFDIIKIINTGELNIELLLYCKIREQI